MFVYNLVAAIANFFGRAARNQPLTPAQRAFLRAMDGVVITIFEPALQILGTALWQWYNNQTVAVDWNSVLHNAASAALASAIFVFMKWWRARKDLGSGKASVAPLEPGDVFNVQSGNVPVLTPAGNYQVVSSQAVTITPGSNGTNFPKVINVPNADATLATSPASNQATVNAVEATANQ